MNNKKKTESLLRKINFFDFLSDKCIQKFLITHKI